MILPIMLPSFKKIFCFLIMLLAFVLAGCATVPKDLLKLPEGYLEKRQLQMRKYDTIDREKVISAVAGVLQDLGFILDESETKVGFVAASKKADATDAEQVAEALFLDLLSALAGTYSNYSSQVDAVQYVKASAIVKPSLDGKNTVVRVTFQRVVWNKNNQINRVETINDAKVYQKFFDSLSKSLFLGNVLKFL